MARPRKHVEYIVQRVADLYHYGDKLSEAHTAICVFSASCHTLTYHTSWNDCRRARSEPRKSTVDDIAKILEADDRAKAKLKDEKPT